MWREFYRNLVLKKFRISLFLKGKGAAGWGRGLLALFFLASCVPLPAVQPIDQLATRVYQTPTTTPSPNPTETAVAPMPTVALPPQEQATLAPISRYGEPAGCRQPVAGETLEQQLAYAEQIYGFAGSLTDRLQYATWNPASGKYEPTGKEVLALQVKDVAPEYRLQDLANALLVAGFVPWLRMDEEKKLHVLAVALRPGVMESTWGEYVRSYFDGPLSEPGNDLTVIPMMRLTPCDWMIQQGYAPPVAAGQLEMAGWEQPDFASAAKPFLASTTEDAYAVSYMIDWQDGGDTESPTTMCGPLTWAIIAQAGALPPGYGGWRSGAKSFWLPDPEENGRPWNLFPRWMYTLERHETPIAQYDFNAHPLYAGDMIYTYAKTFGFDHILAVTENDKDGGAYTVTNLIRNFPEKEYTIRRLLLFTPVDHNAGIYRNEWTTDRKNGRTGQKGYEIFRWKWREKDILGQPAPYTVMPGDTLPLVAARWRTPPEDIAAANNLDPTQSLQSGAEIMIPPNR
jgi:hypothetical protein